MATGNALPDRAEVVIIGGGIVGASVAYHLTRMGRTDVVLVEQGQLSSGTTWHAAGLLGQLRATEGGTRLVQYSAQLYSDLEAETGLATGFKRCGGVTVARTEDRMVQLRRTAATAEVYDLECELISPARAKRMRARAQIGPWVDATGETARPGSNGLVGEAYAPMHWEGKVVGLVAMGTTGPAEAQRLVERLPTLTEFGVVSAALLGPAMAGQLTDFTRYVFQAASEAGK